ncbi:hypothetical protein BJY04DRAFT_129509 [Aspergillus karnatakaensis]|uniref:F-box domain protein n=1 Tax=Aspergillus karnatakaensis TaxID=1810916 RepID=UPI003CCE0A61
MLLDFPPELTQLILLNCSTPAFLQAAFTCQALYEVASSCREALVHHLQRTPGPPLDISALSTDRLFPLLKRRAYKQLYGSKHDASCITYSFGRSLKASSLSSQGRVVTTCRNQRAVQILQVDNGQIMPVAQVKIPLLRKGSVEILKTAFHGLDSIYILHRFTPAEETGNHVFEKQSKDCSLVYLTCHTPEKPVGVTSFPEHAEFEPSALAVALDGTFSIAWCHRMFSEHIAVLYTVKQESEYVVADNLVGFFYTSRHLHRWIGNTRGPLITNVAFNDGARQILYHYQSRSLYASYQNIDRSGTPTLYENSVPIQFTDDLSLLFSVGIPFFGTHESLDLDGFAVCRWRYLALGIATHRQEHWTVACLLRSEAVCRFNNCVHALRLERGRRLADWTVVSRLWGFRDSTDSIGCKVATSPHGTRIAVANWNIIYLWALEPGALIEMDSQEYYHPSSRSAATGHIELQPIVLRLEAICSQLRFTTKENELIVVTDRGIIVWDLTPSKKGSTVCQDLPIYAGTTVPDKYVKGV